ncbi:CDAN1-interacting nuclease 1-like [Argiope bruennichi]|uniref:CDAN1-interacting nuclease 1-like n=1 Tax=Argiope bruennichi TaxID=94029 RepID=UPI0024951268|nr:CDAN1-interacting nuclease 1-like [Argiope bruennichi]
MKIKLSYYQKIVEKYREINKRECLEDLRTAFPDVPTATLCSIISQEIQRKTKRTFYFHASPHNVSKYYKKYLNELESNKKQCGILLKIADEVDLSPALLARLILEHHCKLNLDEKDKEEKEPVPKSMISEMLKNPQLIQDKDLGAEVKLCVLVDNYYGPLSDVIRNVNGLETENRLKNDLTKLGISFIDEKQLREKGYDKTPDIKLDIPIVYQGHIINWIESKASFGDEERHREYLRDQYWSYYNRFGPGLVIYWTGYIEELNSCTEQGIIISDSIPTEISFMDPLILMKKTYIDEDVNS